jgi:hypothetical protein
MKVILPRRCAELGLVIPEGFDQAIHRNPGAGLVLRWVSERCRRAAHCGKRTALWSAAAGRLTAAGDSPESGGPRSGCLWITMY